MISYGELIYGAANSAFPEKNRAKVLKIRSIYPINLSDQSIRSIYPIKLSDQTIRSIYPINLSDQSIRSIYPINLSDQSIRSIYPINLSDQSIRSIYPINLSDQSIRSIYPIIPVDEIIMETFGDLKASLRQAGNTLADMDLLIGATALAGDFTLVTNNIKHFSKIPGLKLDNWMNS